MSKTKNKQKEVNRGRFQVPNSLMFSDFYVPGGDTAANILGVIPAT